jgi:hypothetical protein
VNDLKYRRFISFSLSTKKLGQTNMNFVYDIKITSEYINYTYLIDINTQVRVVYIVLIIDCCNQFLLLHNWQIRQHKIFIRCSIFFVI